MTPGGGKQRPKSDEDSGAKDGHPGRSWTGKESGGGGYSTPSDTAVASGGDSKPGKACGQEDSGSEGLNREEAKARKDNLATSLLVSKVVFCDRDGNERTTFRSSESIYSLVTFKNPTQRYVYIVCNRGTFKRRGVFMEIEGCPTNYVPKPYPRPRVEVVCISPGKEYTFTRLMCKPEGIVPRVRLSTPTGGSGSLSGCSVFASQRARQAKISLENGTKMDVLCVPSLIKNKSVMFSNPTIFFLTQKNESQKLSE